MSFNVEQFAAISQSSINSFFSFSYKAFDAAVALGELTAKEAKANLQHAQVYAQRVVSIKDANDYIALQKEAAEPLMQRTLAFQQQAAEIVKSVRAEFAESLNEKFEESRANFAALADNTLKNMPAGSETLVAAASAGLKAANAAYDNGQKVLKQAGDVLENNFSTVVKQIEKSVAGTAAPAARGKKAAEAA